MIRAGRMTRGQAFALATYSMRYSVSLEALTSPGALFSHHGPLCLEIGIGNGDNLVAAAARHPERNYLGCEVHRPGIGHALLNIERAKLENTRLVEADACDVIAMLPAVSVHFVTMFFPDPWPKTRHHKRRIIGPSTIPHLARILRDGAELRVATDEPTYKGWILEHVLGSGNFHWTARRPSDWRQRPGDWPRTRYEAKAARQGRRGVFLRFLRNPR